MRFSLMLYLGLLCALSNVHAYTPTLQNIDGHEITLKSLKGKWVYINYWASWCAPCLHEIPEINRFYQQYKTKNIAIFGVNYDGLSSDEQRPLIEKYQLNYPSLGIDPADALKLGDIRGVPVTFVFNPEGKLFDIKYGEQTVKSLSAYL
ncbi:MAG: TlpA family protein disulfide reductase [Gammaproteobacteria bacterium]|nr:TlpA family protein disulfide reductase [Gammaproteobacteria bacterium]